MREKFLRELAALGLPGGPDAPGDPVGEADLEPLPEPARRYLRFMGAIGRPRDWSFRLGLSGRFRMSPRQGWMRCDAWQYDTRLALARIFYLELRLYGVLPVLGRDTYVGGRGRMLVRALDLVTVEDGTGEAFDVGEMVTYLNDCVLLAPTMLLGQARWSEVDAGAFDVALTDHGRTVTGRVFVDARGAPTDFETTDRFYADPKDAKKVARCRWTTPIAGWREAGDRRLPTRATAVWHPPEGDFTYIDVEFDPGRLSFNVAPGE